MSLRERLITRSLPYNITAPCCKSNQVLEIVSLVCDGRSTSTLSGGTLTTTNVDEAYNPSQAWEDIPGSVVQYKPPEGTSTVVVEFSFSIGKKDASSLISLEFQIGDGNESETFTSCIPGAQVKGVYNVEYGDHVHMILPISVGNSSEDLSIAKVGTWDSLRTIKVRCFEYSGDTEVVIHSTYYWANTYNSSNTDTFHLIQPTISIKAIGARQYLHK